jgi:spore maturation protein A
MLNYIWVALIVIGILVAVAGDWRDLSTNKYHNGDGYETVLQFSKMPSSPLIQSQIYSCTLVYSEGLGITQRAELIPGANNSGVLHIFIDDNTPPLWREIFKVQKNDFLLAHVVWQNNVEKDTRAKITFDPVKFVKMNAVTNEGIIKYAKTAVELAIGLIGIMALWLGIMKIAEQSGLVAKLASALKPITTRLFPIIQPWVL